MSKQVIYTPSAIQDLEEILAYIAQDNPRAAEKIGRELRERIGELSKFPQLGRTLKDYGFGDHRAIVVDNCIAFYVVDSEEVQVRRVLHGARRFEPLLAEKME